MIAATLLNPGPVESRPLVVAPVPTPRPRAGEVLIRVRACGVCRTDLHVVEGELEPRRRPVIPGHQVVGLVEALGEGGEGATAWRVGDRVGAAWLRRTCGECAYCASGRENLCDAAAFNGWTADGGFAEFMAAPADFLYPIPAGFADEQAAPLLCAGIIGYRALRLTGLDAGGAPGTGAAGAGSAASTSGGGWRGARLGLYGFGAAGHVAIQLARGRGAEVYVCTRDRQRHQSLALELGAAWVGGAEDRPPDPLDAAVIFAPAGNLVPAALGALRKGGVLVLGGIHMSDLPPMPYRLLYGERVVRSVTNNTRADGREFLAEAAALPVRTRVETFPLAAANEALAALKHDAVRGATVLVM
jgi:propanol-preferring alcohol dehydrogenase